MKLFYSDDPSNPLNRRIEEIASWAVYFGSSVSRCEVEDLCREIYELGFNDGQAHVWASRSQPVDVDTEQEIVITAGVSDGEKVIWDKLSSPEADFVNDPEYAGVVQGIRDYRG